MATCKCGCGEWAFSTWVNGHQNRGRTHIVTEETKKTMSESKKGEKNPNWKGKSYYPSTREKMSKALKGLKRTEETKIKIAISKEGEKNPNWKGKSCYPSTREKMRINSKGEKNPNWSGGGLAPCKICNTLFWQAPNQKRTMCSKKCRNFHQSTILRGENGPNWQGGIGNLPYTSDFNKFLKKQIRNRDDGMCKNPECRGNTTYFCVHHIDYDKENVSNSNLIYLCFSCNSRANYNRPYWQSIYEKIMDEQVPQQKKKIIIIPKRKIVIKKGHSYEIQ